MKALKELLKAINVVVIIFGGAYLFGFFFGLGVEKSGLTDPYVFKHDGETYVAARLSGIAKQDGGEGE